MDDDIKKALASVWGNKKGEESKGKQLLGSAFFISPTLLVTCKHVVEELADNEYLYVKFVGEHDAQLVALEHDPHPKNDLALLTLEKNSPDNAVISLATQKRSTVSEKGMVSTAYGFRQDTHACDNNKGEIGVYSEHYEKLTFYPKVPFGFSGGPLFDETNRCIGVTIAKSSDTECSYAEPIYRIHDWLNELGVKFRKPKLQPWQQDYLRILEPELKLLRLDSMLQNVILQNKNSINTSVINLTDVYSPLEVIRSQKLHFSDNGTESKISGIRALASYRYLVMRGDPGCGKSTFTRYWAYRLAFNCLCNKDIESVSEIIPQELLGCFPIYIELEKLYKKISIEDKEDNNFSPRIIHVAINQLFEDEYLGIMSISDIQSYAASGNLVLWFFDGLDEVYIEDSRRDSFLSQFNKWVVWLGENHRVCLTTRPYAYSKRSVMPCFDMVDFLKFSQRSCVSFINNFYSVLIGFGFENSIYKIDELISMLFLDEWEHLLSLCLNPMLASLVCVLFYRDGKKALPKNRAGLYKKCIHTLLGRWEDKYAQGNYQVATFFNGVTVKRSELIRALTQLAFHAHLRLTNSSTDGQSAGDVTEELLNQYFISELPVENNIFIDDVKSYLHDYTGILVDRNNGLYAFSHRTFREFLTSRFILKNDSIFIMRNIFTSFEHDPGWWREPIALIVLQYDTNNESDVATNFLTQLISIYSREENLIKSQISVEAILVISDIVYERTIFSSDISRGHEALNKALKVRIISCLLEIINEENVEITKRIEAGKYLGLFGDPRPGVSNFPIANEDEPEIPDILWAEIPPCKSIISIDNFENHFEVQYSLKMSVYPVTRKQFKAFLDHPKGYNNNEWWEGEERTYQECGAYYADNYPQSNLSLNEAIAFCKWLTSVLGQADRLPIKDGIIRLPYEWEWQNAAISCGPNQAAPWDMGCIGVNPLRSNIGNKIGDIVAVGIYSRNTNNFGVYDLIGNTNEWCGNDFKTLSRSIEGSACLRGGDCLSNANMAAFSTRLQGDPSAKDIISSIRLVCVPHQEK